MPSSDFSQLAAELLDQFTQPGTKYLNDILDDLVSAHNKAVLEMLDDIEADIKACSDCPKDESPSIHLLKYRAELTNERAE